MVGDREVIEDGKKGGIGKWDKGRSGRMGVNEKRDSWRKEDWERGGKGGVGGWDKWRRDIGEKLSESSKVRVGLM